MSLFIAIIFSSTARILKIPSLVPNPDLNPVCPLLISLSKMASFLSMRILSNSFVTWLIRQMVRYSEQTGITDKIEIKWSIIKESITNATTNLPKCQKQAKKEWMTGEILELMKQRKEQKNKSEVRYQKLEKEIRNKCREAKEKWYNEQCEEIEELEKGYKMNKMHAKIKELTNRKHSVKTDSGCIKDKDGNLLLERDEIAKRWTQYIKSLYSDETRNKPEDFENPEGPEILIEEVKKAIEHLKESKAPGEDGITGEHLKALDEEALKTLTDILNDIYNTGVLPNDLKQSVFVKIPKKPKAVECTEYRTICLMSH